jgi:hypothetical protein
MKKAGQSRRNASDGPGGMKKQMPLAPRERRYYKASICASPKGRKREMAG